MTTTTDQDEELLIISDDWDDVIEMDIDLNEEASDDSEVISFDEEITIDDTLEIKAEETTQTNKLDLGGLSIESDKSEELDLDFDLGWEDSEMTVEKMLWDKEDIILEKSEDNNSSESTEDLFDFGLEEETLDIVEEKIEVAEIKEEDSLEGFSLEADIQEEIVEEKTTEDTTTDTTESALSDISLDMEEDSTISDITVWAWLVAAWASAIWGDDYSTGDDDVNAILNATIAKLNARKEKIESVKEETIESIAKLNEEIKGLQSEVKTHKGEVKEFDKETKKIDENVSELEKMKMK